MWFLGIDVGTTHIKVVGVTAEGVVLDPLRVRTPTSIRNGETYHDAEAIWAAVQDLAREYAAGPVSQADAGALAAISIGTFGQEEAVPVDEHGAPLAGSRAWWESWSERALDPEDVAWLDSLEHYGVSGMRFRDNQTPERVAQLRARTPDVWARTHRWVDFGSFLGFRLTGEWAVSSTQITHSQVFELATLQPHAPTLARLGLDASLFPRVAVPGTFLGAIAASALPRVDLAPAAAVFVGGHDQVLAAYANAMQDDTAVLDSIGTAEYIMVTGGATIPDERLYTLCADVEHGWAEGQNVLGWGLPTGKILQQLADRFFDGEFERLLSAIDPTSHSSAEVEETDIVFTVNDLRTIDDELFFIVGTRADDPPEHIVNECVSQLSSRIGGTVRLLADIGRIELDSIALTGSLFQRPELVRHRERIWGVPLTESNLGEAVATGAAQLAGASYRALAKVDSR